MLLWGVGRKGENLQNCVLALCSWHCIIYRAMIRLLFGFCLCGLSADHAGPQDRYARKGNDRGISARELVRSTLRQGQMKAFGSISQRSLADLGPLVKGILLRSILRFSLIVLYLQALLLSIHIPVLPSNTSRRSQLSLLSLSHRLLWGIKTAWPAET